MNSTERNRIKLVISDFHLGAGKHLTSGRRNPLEDFHEDDRMFELLEHYSTGKYADFDVELVINGDFFDLLAVVTVPVKGKRMKIEYPAEVEESAAVEKFRTIVEGHPVAMEGLKNFLSRGKKIIFRWGNHDAGILWPDVQTYLRKYFLPARPDQIEFQQRPYIFDRICIDHGHQYEVVNEFDEDNLFVVRKTKQGLKKILNLPFGSFFVLGLLNPMKLKRSYINLVYPLRTYVQITFFMDPIFFLIGGIKSAWFFFKMRFVTHPMRFIRFRKTLLIAAEMFRRPSLEEIAQRMLTGPGTEKLEYDTIIMGHNHQAISRVFPGGKLYLNTGTWTPITSLNMATLGHHVLRTYALIEYREGKAYPTLKIWNGQPRISEDFR